MLKAIKNSFETYLSALIPNFHRKDKEFSERIKKRHRIFWNAGNAETVRNTSMDASDSIEKWKDVKNWQRKLSNKYNSREFAVKNGCKVAELYWKGRQLDTLNFDKLPSNYVIRPTIGHSSGLVFLMQNSFNLMDKKTYTEGEMKELMAKALSENQNLEFLIEEFLKNEKGIHKIPDDYKFYMFNGRIAGIQVINRQSSSKGVNTWYDESWKEMINITENYQLGEVQNPPNCLPEMIEYAKKLSTEYGIFARIDFYATDKGAVFGEFTPTPALGKGFTPAGEKLLAEYWDKYCNGLI